MEYKLYLQEFLRGNLNLKGNEIEMNSLAYTPKFSWGSWFNLLYPEGYCCKRNATVKENQIWGQPCQVQLLASSFATLTSSK